MFVVYSLNFNALLISIYFFTVHFLYSCLFFKGVFSDDSNVAVSKQLISSAVSEKKTNS